MTGTHSVVIAGDAVACVSAGDGGGCAHNGGLRHPLLQVLNARCGSGRQQQLKSGKFLVREQLRKEARTAQLFVAARNGGQALVRAATCSETVIGRVKQTTVKLDSTASSFYTVTADVFSNARSAETRKLLEKRVFEGLSGRACARPRASRH